MIEDDGAGRPVIPARLYGVWCAHGGADGLGQLVEHVDFDEARGPCAFASAEEAARVVAIEAREASRIGLDLGADVVLLGVAPAVLEDLARLAHRLLKGPRDGAGRHEARALIRDFVARALGTRPTRRPLPPVPVALPLPGFLPGARLPC
jgi:hypothetical protein